jgi:hypothetical protein
VGVSAYGPTSTPLLGHRRSAAVGRLAILFWRVEGTGGNGMATVAHYELVDVGDEGNKMRLIVGSIIRH